jgi:hypothetical protein
MHDAYFATLQSRFSGTADNSPALFEGALRRAEGQVPGKQRKRFFPHCRRPARRRSRSAQKKYAGDLHADCALVNLSQVTRYPRFQATSEPCQFWKHE